MGTPDLRNQIVICSFQDDAGEPKSTIEGVLKHSGGTANHNHVLPAGIDIINSIPVGNYGVTSDTKYHYPPCQSWPWIMKL